jgi:hypothetical protein
MQTYTISKGAWSALKNFASLEAAQTFADSLGEGYTATLAPPSEQIPPITGRERVQMGLDFGNTLTFTFLDDNQSSAFYPFTEAQNNALMSKFQSVLSFAQVGSIRQISDMLPSIATDEIFTQARKDNYIAMCANFLAQF